MSQGAGEMPSEEPGSGLGEEDLVDGADERIADVEAEFGPDAPPRGASPGNPQAEEDPS